jgi:hypothetical protein
MARCRSRTDAHQAGDLGYSQSHPTVEQEVAGHPRGGILPVSLLKKLKRRFEHRPLLIAQPLRRNPRRSQPLLEHLTFRGHRKPSARVPPFAAEV